MTVTAVLSNTLTTVAYDHRAEILRLEFRSGAVYIYDQVPWQIHQGLLTAVSKGAYFNQNIRGRFPYQKLEPADHNRDVSITIR